VDQNIRARSSGFRPEADAADNSVNYLRRLKEQTLTDVSTDAASRMRPGAGARSTSSTGNNRRRSPRYHCDGSVEFRAEGSPVRMWGTLTDISMHGCYVEMSATFPVDTKADLVVDALGIGFRAKGIVRISYPFLGMGILLTEIMPEQRVFLDQLLSKLAQATTVANPLTPRDTTGSEWVDAAEPMLLLKELGRFFDSHSTLTREEFARIARKCRRQ